MQDGTLVENPSTQKLPCVQMFSSTQRSAVVNELSKSEPESLIKQSSGSEHNDSPSTNQSLGFHMEANSIHIDLENLNKITSDNKCSTSISSNTLPVSEHLWSATATNPSSEERHLFAETVNSSNGCNGSIAQFPSNMSQSSYINLSNSGFVSVSGSQNSNSITSQEGKRPITGHNSLSNFHRQQANLLSSSSQKVLNWNNSLSSNWTTPPNQSQTANLYPWNLQQQRRSVPNINSSNLKNPSIQTQFQQPFIAPSKFNRSTSFSNQAPPNVDAKTQYDFLTFDDIVSYQNPSPRYDSMKFPKLENQLLDIMKNNAIEGVQMHGDHVKVTGKVPFVVDDSAIEEASHEPNQHFNAVSRSSPSAQGIERFSRKVFVGGLPPDIDEEEITSAFRRFGALVVDWPHKAESKSYFPPKGYCFLIFQDELSVQSLIEACLMDDDKLYWCVSSPTMKNKPVQIRPWILSDSDFVMDGSQPLDPRKTIFVGGVPRPLRAVELAMIMDRLYGGVCYAGIDTDPELKYPKGAGRVAFSNQQSYIAAISARFVQLQHGDIDKRVEVKPYVLDDQMCDECHGTRCAGKFAPFFCANVTCLQYYCEYCWAQIHSRPGREYHKPLVKEGADRPRAVPFRWC